ncbi:MAG: hypothetical protein IJR86_00520 [Bacteroidaceae bacterium]|nr:hypothetical protein [Bacteroidaceae bacterium]
MRVILEGNNRDVRNIIQENRVRVARGLVKFLPSNEEAVEDDKTSGVVDSKAVAAVDGKKPKRVAKKK